MKYFFVEPFSLELMSSRIKCCLNQILFYLFNICFSAVQTKKGVYIIREKVEKGRHHRYSGAGTIFYYSRAKGQSCPGECLFANGPLKEDIIIKVK